MALAGNPKKLAQDIAGGFFMLSPPLLRQYTPVELKTILSNLAIVTRDLRAEQVALDDVMALKGRNMKLSRLRQAETVIRAYGKKQRIPV